VIPDRREEGYALIAAILSIVVFALMALTMINATRSSTVMAAAEIDRAKLSAAADAGISIAVHGLMLKDPTRRWAIDGKVRRETFNGTTLDIIIEDERGKIGLNLINKSEVEAMFAAFGVQGLELEAAVDSFMDWRDEDDDPRPRGGEFEVYAPKKIKPRNGELRTLGELALIVGIGPELAQRMIPYTTVNFGTGEFDPRYASELAIRVSSVNEISNGIVDTLDSEAEKLRKTVEAFRTRRNDSLVGRPLTIRVTAKQRPDKSAQRTAIIELTGSDVRPFVIRARE
jgi:general secretion pathway protein K